MRTTEEKAYAKINIGLDVLGRREDGYHTLKMVMQTIDLCDDVLLRFTPGEGAEGLAISMGTNRPYLPTDRRNLAWQAAEIVIRDSDFQRSPAMKIVRYGRK